MGEKVQDLVPALQAFADNGVPTGNGMWHSSCDLSFAEFAPLARAVMRLESRLLREDANRLIDEGAPGRTPDQRRADAFIELLKLIQRATSASSRRAQPVRRRAS
jgi:hypothetical protein